MLLNLSVFPLKIVFCCLFGLCLFVILRVRNISPICDQKDIPGAGSEAQW